MEPGFWASSSRPRSAWRDLQRFGTSAVDSWRRRRRISTASRLPRKDVCAQLRSPSETSPYDLCSFDFSPESRSRRFSEQIRSKEESRIRRWKLGRRGSGPDSGQQGGSELKEGIGRKSGICVGPGQL